MIRNTIAWSAIANLLLWTPQLEASEVTKTENSAYAKVRAIGLSEVQWTSGFWAERFATCQETSLPAMWELMKGGKYKPFYQHFPIASGMSPSNQRPKLMISAAPRSLNRVQRW